MKTAFKYLILMVCLAALWSCDEENEIPDIWVSGYDNNTLSVVPGETTVISVRVDKEVTQYAELYVNGTLVDKQETSSWADWDDYSNPYNFSWQVPETCDNITLKVVAYSYYGKSNSLELTAIPMCEGYSSVQDTEGNTYMAKNLGGTVWMLSNLKSTTLNDGSEMTSNDITSWKYYDSPSYGYDQSLASPDFYYNWYAVSTGKLCPEGWSIPSDLDWQNLENYFGVSEDSLSLEGFRGNTKTRTLMESQLNANYTYSNPDADEAYWWTSTAYNAEDAWKRMIRNNQAGIYRGIAKYQQGYSVRCIKGKATEAVEVSFYNVEATAITSSSVSLSASVKQSLTSYEFGFVLSTDNTYQKVGGSNCMTCGLEGTLDNSFQNEISYLQGNTMYFYTAYINYNNQYYYSSVDSFTTASAIEYGEVIDIDENVYKTVTIGDQEWIAENLKTTHYYDGSEIPNVTNNTTWAGLTTPAYCWYDNNSENKETYGALYNWYAVNTYKLCPEGWHVPTDEEWTTLNNYIESNGHKGTEATALKATSGWNYNGNGTDNYGFNALPGGNRPKGFNNIGYYGLWWSSNEYESNIAWRLILGSSDSKITIENGDGTKDQGCSIRCLKGAPTVQSVTITNYEAGDVLETVAYLKAKLTESINTNAYGFVYSSTDDTPMVEKEGTCSTIQLNDGGIPGIFMYTLEGLKPATTYYFTGYVYIDGVYYYGTTQSFTTQELNVTLTNNNATDITETTAYLSATLNQKWTTSQYGFVFSSSNDNPQVDNEGCNTYFISDGGINEISGTLESLSSGTTYYFTAYVLIDGAYYYGDILSFTTEEVQQTGEVTDIDGNTYNTVKIGTQWWMAENLKVTKYPDGTSVPYVYEDAAWAQLADSNYVDAYCYYNNGVNGERNTYGALYTYAAAIGDNWERDNKANQGICPDGWHLPDDSEWTELTTFLGGESVAGGKLKESGISHWNSPNANATNESGFNALPGGYRNSDGTFPNIGYNGYWWSATDVTTNIGWYRDINFYDSTVTRQVGSMKLGFSIRCVKD